MYVPARLVVHGYQTTARTTSQISCGNDKPTVSRIPQRHNTHSKIKVANPL